MKISTSAVRLCVLITWNEFKFGTLVVRSRCNSQYYFLVKGQHIVYPAHAQMWLTDSHMNFRLDEYFNLTQKRFRSH